MVMAIILVLTVWSLSFRYHDRIFSQEDLDVIPPRSVALVFGAGYWEDGTLSDILRDRLDAAIELYHAGKVEKMLFSGDNRVKEYNEPAKMKEYTISQGVNDDDIVLDFAGRRTYDTCYRANDIFQVKDVILVTQRYHASRALMTCDVFGMDALAYTADRMPYAHIKWYWLREIPALWKTWWDLFISQPIPVLGDPLPI